jgi:3',5'-cyclic AMP phosphodiesterase CpdA
MQPWTFVHVADMQPGSPMSYRYNPSWIANWREAKAQILAIAPDLLLAGGDLTRDGSIRRYELEQMKAELELPFPVHVVAGNTDTAPADTPRPTRGTTPRRGKKAAGREHEAA